MVSEEDIKKRNKLAESVFFKLGFEVKAYGNINTPRFILKDKIILNCFVHNFILIFTDKAEDGDHLFNLRLNEDVEFTEQFIEMFVGWIGRDNHRECFSIRVKETQLRLSGYNFINNATIPENRYPVFSEKNFKLYFNKKYAEGVVLDYSSETLKLELI